MAKTSSTSTTITTDPIEWHDHPCQGTRYDRIISSSISAESRMWTIHQRQGASVVVLTEYCATGDILDQRTCLTLDKAQDIAAKAYAHDESLYA